MERERNAGDASNIAKTLANGLRFQNVWIRTLCWIYAKEIYHKSQVYIIPWKILSFQYLIFWRSIVIIMCIYWYIVCIYVELRIAKEDTSKNVRWTLGDCSSMNVEMYENKGSFAQRCCLTPGRHILTCENSNLEMGWKNAKILIDGHSYCDDFLAYKAMRVITVTGIKIR